MKKLERNKGITLIALAIAMVVLLILAGITISALSGENGILNRATEAKQEARGAAVEEAKNLWMNSIKMDEKTDSSEALSLGELLLDLERKNLLTASEVKKIKNEGFIEIGSHFINFSIDGSFREEFVWPKLQPGLYATGTTNMIKSWDKLKEDGDIIVEDNEIMAILYSVDGDLIISDEIVKINTGARCGFTKQYKLTGVYIPESVLEMNSFAFYDFEYLKTAVLNSKVIDFFAFKYTRLEKLAILKNVSTIKDDAFYCSIGEFYYEGSLSDWNKISIGNGNDKLQDKYKEFYVIYAQNIINGLPVDEEERNEELTNLFIEGFKYWKILSGEIPEGTDINTLQDIWDLNHSDQSECPFNNILEAYEATGGEGGYEGLIEFLISDFLII